MSEEVEEEYQDQPTNGIADGIRYLGMGLGWMFAFIGMGCCFLLGNLQIKFVPEPKVQTEITKLHEPTK